MVFNDRALGDAVAREFKKPAGKFHPPPKFTEAELELITSINLEGTKITDAGLKELAKLQKLERLFLCHTQITDAGLKELTKLKNLKKLSLEGTQITDAGLKELANMQNLQELWLTDAKKIGLADGDELQKALPNCKIYGAGWWEDPNPPRETP